MAPCETPTPCAASSRSRPSRSAAGAAAALLLATPFAVCAQSDEFHANPAARAGPSAADPAVPDDCKAPGSNHSCKTGTQGAPPPPSALRRGRLLNAPASPPQDDAWRYRPRFPPGSDGKPIPVFTYRPDAVGPQGPPSAGARVAPRFGHITGSTPMGDTIQSSYADTKNGLDPAQRRKKAVGQDAINNNLRTKLGNEVQHSVNNTRHWNADSELNSNVDLSPFSPVVRGALPPGSHVASHAGGVASPHAQAGTRSNASRSALPPGSHVASHAGSAGASAYARAAKAPVPAPQTIPRSSVVLQYPGYNRSNP